MASEKCLLCDEIFSSLLELKTHLLFHTGEEIVSCELCSKSFATQSDLDAHARGHSRRSLFKCSQCDANFHLRFSLKRHLQQSHPDSTLDSVPSSDSFDNIDSNLAPKASIVSSTYLGSEDLNECNEGQANFISRNHPKSHDEELNELPSLEDSTEEHPDALLPKGLFSVQTFTESDDLFTCSECQERFLSKNDLIHHVQLSHSFQQSQNVVEGSISGYVDLFQAADSCGESLFECNECDVNFSIQHDLTRGHLQSLEAKDSVDGDSAERITYGESEGSFKCDEYGKTFRLKSDLIHHVHLSRILQRSPNTEDFTTVCVGSPAADSLAEVLKCDNCNATFSCEDELMFHNELSHDPQQSLEAELSVIGPQLPASLYDESEDSFKCSECGMAFSLKIDLLRHIQQLHAVETEADLVSGKVKANSETNPSITATNTENKSKCHKCNGIFPSRDLKRHVKSHAKIKSSKRLLMCESCGKLFPTKQALEIHNRVHTGEKPLKCDVCDARFRYPRSLKYHIEAHSSDGPKEKSIVCNICGKSFLRKYYLSEHKKIHAGDRPWKCKECGKAFIYPNVLKQHEKTHARKRKKPSVCLLCGQSYPTKYDIAVHFKECHQGEEIAIDGPLEESRDESFVDEETGKRRWVCKICEKTFCSKTVLANHNRIHKGERRYKCEKCKAAFLRPGDLNAHLQIHLEDRRFECELCHKVLKTEVGLKNHLARHAGDCPFRCRFCEASFIEERALKNHEATHSEDRRYLCEACPKKFKTAELLRAHTMARHSSRKPFKCTVTTCGAMFATRGLLKRHLRGTRHVLADASVMDECCKTSETALKAVGPTAQIFSCVTCGKRFAREETLVEHERTHTGERPLICPTCGRAFASRANLWRHSLTHAPIRPFRCKECGFSCGTNPSLRRHITSVHSRSYPHVCDVCGAGFVFPHELRRHSRAHEKTPRRDFVCEECGKAFKYKSHMYRHKESHRKKSPCEESDSCSKSIGDELSLLIEDLLEDEVF